MNETDREKLLRDVAATGLAAGKTRRRRLRVFVTGSCGAAACLFLVLRIHSPEEIPTRSREVVEAPAPPQPANPPPVLQTEREKEETLLNTLSDAGPVIITMADGSRQLYLTRP